MAFAWGWRMKLPKKLPEEPAPCFWVSSFYINALFPLTSWGLWVSLHDFKTSDPPPPWPKASHTICFCLYIYVAEASSDDDSLSLGSPGDLEEIADADLDADTSSTVAPSSDVSSLTPTVNTKLGRVIEQLKGLVVCSQKDGSSSTTSKGDGDVVMDILSSDEEPGSQKPIEGPPTTSVTSGARLSIGEYLKSQKKPRALGKENEGPENPKAKIPENPKAISMADKSSVNPHVLPKSASWR